MTEWGDVKLWDVVGQESQQETMLSSRDAEIISIDDCGYDGQAFVEWVPGPGSSGLKELVAGSSGAERTKTW